MLVKVSYPLHQLCVSSALSITSLTYSKSALPVCSQVESMVVSVCKPNEVDKFRMFIGDLDKVVSLLLSLSGRLLRVETTLDTLDPDTEHHERVRVMRVERNEDKSRCRQSGLVVHRALFLKYLYSPSPSLSALQLPLLEKKRQLMRQLSEAQDLKDHVDRREQAVSRVLARCLSPEQHRDYRWDICPVWQHKQTHRWRVLVRAHFTL